MYERACIHGRLIHTHTYTPAQMRAQASHSGICLDVCSHMHVYSSHTHEHTVPTHTHARGTCKAGGQNTHVAAVRTRERTHAGSPADSTGLTRAHACSPAAPPAPSQPGLSTAPPGLGTLELPGRPPWWCCAPNLPCRVGPAHRALLLPVAPPSSRPACPPRRAHLAPEPPSP